MKAWLLVPVAPLLVSATPPSLPLGQPAYDAPAKAWPDIDAAEAARACRDRIEQVRDQAGRPKLERGPASPDKPLMMYAVDHRVDGCGVLVPVSDPADIRPAPEPGEVRLIPAYPARR